MDRFYNDLAPFDIFGECAGLGAYEPVPDGWHVAIADIRGSTKAIEAGRYKDVNMMGAAAIAAVLNISGDIEVPFVFGGDGGTVLVPASLRDAAADALARLRGLSESAFGLEMRTGTVPVAAARARPRGQGDRSRARYRTAPHGDMGAVLPAVDLPSLPPQDGRVRRAGLLGGTVLQHRLPQI